MRKFWKSVIVCLLCVLLFIPSACAPRDPDPGPLTTPTPEQTPTAGQPSESPDPVETPEPEPSPEPVPMDEPLLDIDPVHGGDTPAVHPDEETTLAYDLDGLSGEVPAVLHCNIHGYSIVYDAIHYERRTYEGMDSYWSEAGLYLSISMLYGSSIDFVLDGLMLQENIEMVPRTTVVGADGYLAYTLYHTVDGLYRQFWVLDYKGDALLIEQSYPVEHEFVDFHRAVQQAMLDSLVLVEHDTAAIAVLRGVLELEQPVVPAAGGDAVTLEEHLTRCEAEAGVDMDYIAFSYCDLDGDGTVELILCHVVGEANAWFDILRYDHEDGAVYLYERSYRGLLQLKTDGTFHYSSGASDSGIGTLRFEGSETVTQPISWVESGDGTEVRCFVDGEPADAAAYNLAAVAQAAKNAVVWYSMD